MFLHLRYEACAALRIGVSSVHEAVKIYLVQSVFFRYVAKGKQMVQAGVHAACRCQTHEMHGFTVVACVGKCRYDLFVLHYGLIGYGAVNLYQVLVNDTSGTDV